MEIGLRIKNRRIQLGLTQLELSQRMGYTNKTTICKVESGKDNLTSDRVEKFAKALNTTPAWIMGWDDNEPSKLDEIKPEQQGKNDRLLLEKIHSLNDKNYAILTSMLDTLLNSQEAD